MPGMVATDIAENSRRVLGLPPWEELSDADLLKLLPDNARAGLVEAGLLPENFTAEDLRQLAPKLKSESQDTGFTAAKAAAIILDGVRSGAWRVLVGEEAEMLDEQARADPQAPFSYEKYAEMYHPLIERALAETSQTPEP